MIKPFLRMSRIRLFILSAGLLAVTVPCARAADRPNILWLTSEDHGPQMGCYGDAYASTPHIDRLAAKGMIYMHAWSNAPVCAGADRSDLGGVSDEPGR